MKAIKSFLNYRPNADTIRKQMNLPFLRLDVTVPANTMLEEAQSLKDSFVSHRTKDKLFGRLAHRGWCSITLYGADSTTTTKTEEPFDWTEASEHCPETVAWLKQNFDISETTGRIRFMLLEAGGYILPHSDRDQRRLSEINIALNNPKGCVFRFLERGDIPFKTGEAYIIDTSNKHMVYNDSKYDRIHMIVHNRIDDDLLVRSYAKSYYS